MVKMNEMASETSSMSMPDDANAIDGMCWQLRDDVDGENERDVLR